MISVHNEGNEIQEADRVKLFDRLRPDTRWYLDEVFVSINGGHFYVWRAVDSEGEQSGFEI